jgi:hypothetical protein
MTGCASHRARVADVEGGLLAAHAKVGNLAVGVAAGEKPEGKEVRGRKRLGEGKIEREK